MVSKAQQIAQNGESQNTYDGWKQINEPRSRSILIKEIMSPNWSQLRATIYSYHRAGLDNLFNQDQSQGKKVIFDALMQLKNTKTHSSRHISSIFLWIPRQMRFSISSIPEITEELFWEILRMK
jgi:hypothetical protein